MKKKLNCILLIDDDDADNFFHKRVIKKAGVAEKTVAINNGEEALTYLKSKDNGKHPKPDLIFLDVNMPGMNGWEFLEYYNELDESVKGEVIVVMLSTSLNPDDHEKSQKIETVRNFNPKPLTQEMLFDTIEKYFPHYM